MINDDYRVRCLSFCLLTSSLNGIGGTSVSALNISGIIKYLIAITKLSTSLEIGPKLVPTENKTENYV